MLGSIDANTGSPDLGWDTDQFPMDTKNSTLVMKVCMHFIQTFCYTVGFSLNLSVGNMALTLPLAYVPGISLASALTLLALLTFLIIFSCILVFSRPQQSVVMQMFVCLSLR